MKIFIAVICLITLPVLIESCCLDSCCGESFNVKDFTINDIDMAVGVKGTSPVEPLPAITSVREMEFVFAMDVTDVAMIPSIKPTMAAFACSPPEPKSKELLNSLTIKSNNNLSTDRGNFAAGEDLSSIFTMDNGSLLPANLYQHQFRISTGIYNKEASEHIFTITLSFDDGRNFTFETGKINLLAE